MFLMRDRITANQGFYLLGLDNTSPTFASAIQNSVPAITFLMAALLRQVLDLKKIWTVSSSRINHPINDATRKEWPSCFLQVFGAGAMMDMKVMDIGPAQVAGKVSPGLRLKPIWKRTVFCSVAATSRPLSI